MTPSDRERVYADVFHQLGDALIVTDLDGKIIDWNRGAENIFGYTREEALGRTPAFLFRPEEQPTLAKKVLDEVARSGRWLEEITVVHKDGTLRFCEALVVPLLDENGKAYLTIGVNRDITRRREAEEELRLAAEILDHMGEAALLVRRDDLTCVHMNSAFRTLFGYEPEEVLGQHVAMLNSDDVGDPDAVASAIADELERAGSWAGDIRNIDKAGRRFWTHVDITSFEHHRHGEVWLTIQRDVTALREAELHRRTLEDQLLRAQRLESLGTLASGVAHDFNNVLQGILTAAESALARADANAESAGDLSTAVQLAERGRNIVRRILAFAKVQEPSLRAVDLHELVTQTVAMLRPLLPVSIFVKTDFASVPCIVRGDPSQLQQMLVNLCTNASFAMREHGGVLTLGVEPAKKSLAKHDEESPSKDWLRLSIRDTGEGIPPEIERRVFDPFFTTKQHGDGEGSGLGLAIVHSIVDSHGGTIALESSVGAGTRFDVFLPRAQPGVTRSNDSAPTTELTGARVLFVDDEDLLLPIFVRALADHGLIVETARSGEEALRMFRRHSERFDAVVTDLRMPGMSGVELSRKLAEIRPQCPVVVMTGVFAQGEIARAPTVRANLTKPFTTKELVGTLDRVLTGNGSTERPESD